MCKAIDVCCYTNVWNYQCLQKELTRESNVDIWLIVARIKLVLKSVFFH